MYHSSVAFAANRNAFPCRCEWHGLVKYIHMNVIAPVPAWLVNVTLHRCALGLEIILLLMRQIDEWFVFFGDSAGRDTVILYIGDPCS